MPVPPKGKQREEEDPLVQYTMDRWEEFEDPTAWSLSKRNPENIWRMWEGLTVTVFRRNDDFYGYSIADSDGPRYSKTAYETQEEALYALGDELGINDEC